jgi:glycosyltransferase involved in cell wall biosynthesis
MTIVAVIPAFNEEVHIHDVIKKAKHYVDEVIVVDDCSNDATSFIAQSLGARLIRHDTNMGKVESLKSGFKAAKELDPRIIVTLYANGYHNPEDIPSLVEPIFWLEADVVTGNTLFKDQDVLSVLGMDDNLEGSFICDTALDTGLIEQCMGFTAFSSNMVDSLQFYENGTSVELSLLKDAKKSWI